MTTLKPCPFCGASSDVRIDDGKYPHIVCATCGARGPGGYNVNSASERWNERHRKPVDLTRRCAA
jgi:Lar family restriction alleviation protein